MSAAFLASLDEALASGVSRVEQSDFARHVLAGEHVKPLYVAYLREAWHYVRLTSSFTPLAARRMNPELTKIRQWVLRHSAEEIGHEYMALNDLLRLGFSREAVERSEPLAGTWGWIAFFHYQVAVRPPFAAFGVLYFLEGMATRLAPVVARQVAAALSPEERKATTFFREHGDLDVDHLAEQREVLARYCTDDADRQVVRETILQAAEMKRFMLDFLTKSVLEAT